jgi:hypothetical protein
MQDESPRKKKSGKASKEDRKSQDKPEDNVVKPKMVFSPFFLFASENRKKLIKANPNLKVTEVAKQNGIDWKNATDSQRKKYDELVKKDRIRFEKEMKEFNETGFYTDANGVNSKFMDKKHRVLEFPKDTVMPKMVATAYMCFTTEALQQWRDQKKEGEKLVVVDKMKECGATWGQMTAAKKAKYEKLHQKDQERYNK